MPEYAIKTLFGGPKRMKEGEGEEEKRKRGGIGAWEKAKKKKKKKKKKTSVLELSNGCSYEVGALDTFGSTTKVEYFLI